MIYAGRVSPVPMDWSLTCLGTIDFNVIHREAMSICIRSHAHHKDRAGSSQAHLAKRGKIDVRKIVKATVIERIVVLCTVVT
jgi:hypothetical protein